MTAPPPNGVPIKNIASTDRAARSIEASSSKGALDELHAFRTEPGQLGIL